MHISDQYGQVEKGVQDMALPGLISPCDLWTEGARQKELNERGAYIHRFQDQSSLSSMIAAVKKISEDNICTPCTLVGPSLCRTYNHHVWEGCAALLFSPSMPVALAYKGDIYSHRLSLERDLNHSKYQTSTRSRTESLELFSDVLRIAFNKYGPTASAFKGRRSKKLNLVVSASHQAAKIREMEKRANLYFIAQENRSIYKLDTSSKELIVHLSNQYQDFNLPIKPVLQTKAQVLEFIDAVVLSKPFLLPFLEAPRIKISHFKEDSAVSLYLNNATSKSSKQPHERSYTEFLQWQFSNSQTIRNLHNFSDKSTTLTPNEVLGMPSSAELVGLVIDPSTSKSFDQTLNTLEHLKKDPNSDWHKVAANISPYTHLISHMDEGTILQLGWSKMIIPYSTKGLQEYCATGSVTTIDNAQFKPNYFLLLHRIAASSNLIFSKEHRTVDILYLKPNVITNFASISNSQCNKLLYDAIALPSIRDETLRLFSHLDILSAGNKDNIKNAITNSMQTPDNRLVLDSLLSMDDEQLKEDLDNLLSTQINEIEQSAFKTPQTHRRIKYRGGFQDHGTFEFNLKLGSLSLREGAREFENNVHMIGLFNHSGSMRHGGAELEYGIKFEKEKTRFGKFDGPSAPPSISKQFSVKRNQNYFQIQFESQTQILNINFSKSQSVRLYFELNTTAGNDAIKIQIRNHNWPNDFDQIIEHPSQVLSLLCNTVQNVRTLAPEKLPSGIVCLAAMRCASFDQVMSATTLNSLGSIRHPLHKEATVHLENKFLQLLKDTDATLIKLAATYKDLDPQGDNLGAYVDRLPAALGVMIRDYLASTVNMTIQKPVSSWRTPNVAGSSVLHLVPSSATTPSPTPAPKPASSPASSPAASPPTSTLTALLSLVLTPSPFRFPKTLEKSTIKKLMNRIKRAFNIQP